MFTLYPTFRHHLQGLAHDLLIQTECVPHKICMFSICDRIKKWIDRIKIELRSDLVNPTHAIIKEVLESTPLPLLTCVRTQQKVGHL